MRHIQGSVTVVFAPNEQRRLVNLPQNAVLPGVYHVHEGRLHLRRERLVIGRAAAGSIRTDQFFNAIIERSRKFLHARARLHPRPVHYHKCVYARIACHIQRHPAAEGMRHYACAGYPFSFQHAPNSQGEIVQIIYSVAGRFPVPVKVGANAKIGVLQDIHERRKRRRIASPSVQEQQRFFSPSEYLIMQTIIHIPHYMKNAGDM